MNPLSRVMHRRIRFLVRQSPNENVAEIFSKQFDKTNISKETDPVITERPCSAHIVGESDRDSCFWIRSFTEMCVHDFKDLYAC